MSVERSPQHDIPYHFISYDAHGNECPGEHGLASEELLTAVATEPPTDVFLMSHGWNANPAGALAQYGHWIDTMGARESDRERLRARADGFRPVVAAVHWPSKAWADEDLTGLAYDVADDAAAADLPTQPATALDPEKELVARYAALLGGGAEVADAVGRIARSAMADVAPPTLPADAREAYEELNARLAMGQEGVGAAPGDDRAPFSAEDTYQATLLMDIVDPVDFAGISLGGVLAPLRVLSFWTMKSRARAFGESGAADLLAHVRDAAPTARIHLVGHSFGCIVASAAVRAAVSAGAGPRRGVSTLTLLQGAMSLWSFCSAIPSQPTREGYFHGLVRDRLVAGPVVVTTSVHDRAVRVFYPLGAGARGDVDFGADEAQLPVYGGIGRFGVRGPGIALEHAPLEDVDERYVLRGGVFYNLDADRIITTSAGISGAHSDICHPEVARAIWRAVEGQAS